MSQIPDSQQPDGAGPPGADSRPPADPGRVPPPPPPGYHPAMYGAGPAPQPRGRSIVGRIGAALVTTLVLGSICLNVYLIFLLEIGEALSGAPRLQSYLPGDEDQRIVILPIEGVIDEAMYQTVRSSLKVLAADPPKALVLRVSSPGGGVGASNRIHHELAKFKKETKIPIVASFGSYAASGGYYVSAHADFIVSEPTTLTGSIGVMADAFTIQELMSKIGVKPEILTSTDATKKDVLSPFRDWGDEDRQLLRDILDYHHAEFVRIVKDGRGLTDEEASAVGTGQPYLTDEALKLKLVDQEGYLDDAIDVAKKRAGISPGVDPAVKIVLPPESLVEALGMRSGGNGLSLDSPGLRRLLV